MRPTRVWRVCCSAVSLTKTVMLPFCACPGSPFMFKPDTDMPTRSPHPSLSIYTGPAIGVGATFPSGPTSIPLILTKSQWLDELPRCCRVNVGLSDFFSLGD
ncbi:hypothetical protein GALMADRAFT_795941 [Galerina marginata CBS 339.88]|uniref:Secreted protein n=1 Tax=Galerina marginata (strain CBS 339.88) TaxID=685588 RepID=A0A067SJY6_GALM3|nr:hypothetical protein GALMADRAFT_795941 [Galerina marginata CBS 339.88]